MVTKIFLVESIKFQDEMREWIPFLVIKNNFILEANKSFTISYETIRRNNLLNYKNWLKLIKLNGRQTNLVFYEM